MMLTCTPLSICSWNFRVNGGPLGPATLLFNTFTEQGSVSVGDTELAVRKHGPLSGEWTLERDGTTYAEARKPSAMIRSFEMSAGDIQLVLKAESLFTRSFELVTGDTVVGTIRPVHPLTRRANIECGSAVPDLAQLFSFWLVALTWRRQAQNNS